MSRPLLAIVGPTCVGKTALGIDVARRVGAAELINADSRQCRSGTRVATFAPTAEELRGVPCHLLGIVPPGAPFTVADWLEQAQLVLADMATRHVLPIVVGGSGLYVRSLLDGFDFGSAPPDAAAREQRNALAASEDGRRLLVEELLRHDPDTDIDTRNTRRVIRALEILDHHPEGAAHMRRSTPMRDAIVVGLDVSPETHRRWVVARVRDIFCSGALGEEIESLLAEGVPVEAIAGSGIGYVEGLRLMRGELDIGAAIAETVRRTLRYAKSQRTWFRADARVRWMLADETPREDLVTRVAGLLDCKATAR